MREQMRNQLYVLSIMLLFFGAGVANNAQATLFIARDHIVVDLRHGVDWLRCSIGQRWNGETCIGELISLNHEMIAQAIEQANEQLGGEWRLPSRIELEGLVCNECGPPKIDADMFPATDVVPYWTGQINKFAKRHIWSVNFATGLTYGRFFPYQQLAVRLVRDRR